MGLGYALLAGTSWNSVVYFVKGKRVGTAIGVTTCILNIGLVISPILMG